jgi:biotin carboxyl carrier protein
MSSPTYSAAHHEPLGLVEKKPSTRIAGTLWAADKAGVITAVMPGLVVKVLKKEGDRVQAGEVALVLKTMKMQNELRASQSGVVKQINIREGESVSR